MQEPVSVENRLLTILPDRDRQHFLSGCEQVLLESGNVLFQPGEKIRYVYFPIESFIALLRVVEGHSNMEVSLVGSEGMCGTPLVLGVDVSALQAVVQGSGTAWRMDAGSFQSELKHSKPLQNYLNRYLYVRMSQLAQTATCVHFHMIEERLARGLLMTRDRAHSEEFHITHELLAKMLGVRRVGITKAAGSLQTKKLISYNRGKVRIHDICGLESVSCQCYRTDKEIYDRFMLPELTTTDQ